MPSSHVGTTTITYAAQEQDRVEVGVGEHWRGVVPPLDRNYVQIAKVATDESVEEYLATVSDDELRRELARTVQEQPLTFHTQREFETFLGLLIVAGYRAYGPAAARNVLTRGADQVYIEAARETRGLRPS